MQQEINKRYGFYFLILAIVSLIVSFLSFFIPIFKMSILGFSHMENGLFMVKSLFGGEKSEVIDGVFLKYLLVLFALYSALLPFTDIEQLVRRSKKLHKEKHVKATSIISRKYFISSCVYWGIAFFALLKYVYEWNVMDAIGLGSSSYEFAKVTTFLYIPMLLQGAIYVITKILYYNWKQTLAQNGGVNASTSSFSKPIVERSEEEKVELLTHYKQLLDAGVLSETEFNTKKAEIFGTLITEETTSITIEQNEKEKLAYLAKYKELLDNGIIDAEMFEKKKKEIFEKEKEKK